jgi:threonyl-tRNA synthetase
VAKPNERKEHAKKHSNIEITFLNDNMRVPPLMIYRAIKSLLERDCLIKILISSKIHEKGMDFPAFTFR